jgi:hypothetical protein
MAFSQWFQQNNDLVNGIVGQIGQNPQQPIYANVPGTTTFQRGPVQQDAARMDLPHESGNGGAKKILSIVSAIYSGGASAAAGAK